ncbi:MAG: NUDIX domain-containing protein [Candidatus Helarchaeota archaeon]|nr:NUDIX domain-containing protein [Candidatus Helarchaeota archaeon]
MTNFLQYETKILILKRSSKVGTYQGKWAGISGYIEKDDVNPKMRAKIEIFEETGLEEKDIKLVKEGTPLEIIDNEKKILWIVHPFLWDVSTDEIKIDWEHKTCKWIYPNELENYKTVPRLIDTLKRVL